MPVFSTSWTDCCISWLKLVLLMVKVMAPRALVVLLNQNLGSDRIE